MWQDRLARVWKRIAAFAVIAGPWVLHMAHLALGFTRTTVWPFLRLVLETLAALVVLFLDWGWKPLAAALARLSKYLVWAKLEARIAALPPYGALAVFAAPAILLLPLKLFALFLLTTGHPLLAVTLIIAAKLVGTAFVARIFILTQPQLMQIGWFAHLYGIFMPWKERMFTLVRASAAWRTGRQIRVGVKRRMHAVWLRTKPQRTAFLAAAREVIAAIRRRLDRLFDDKVL
jgi:hypothetical protein